MLWLCVSFLKVYKRKPLWDQGKQWQSKDQSEKYGRITEIKAYEKKRKGKKNILKGKKKSKCMSHHISDIFSVAIGKGRLLIDLM